ncbi:MAG: DUF262 domain-containing protein [Byssovorax sp.]
MPPIGSTFRTGEPHLHELLEQVHKGQVQLPDFQRGWVWDDERIRALIASVSLSYPIGAAMLMETGGDGAAFAPRPLEGVTLPEPPPRPERLILDGQQRLTSLYLALRSGKPVVTHNEKNEPLERVYYLDIAACLDPDRERIEAVRGLPKDRILRSNFNRTIDLDVSKPELEYEHGLFPLSLVFDPVGSVNWRQGYQAFHNYAPDKMKQWASFEIQVWQRFQQYKLPIIELLKGTEKEAVCQVFESVNTGGMALTVFELVTAMFASESFRLRKDWEERRKRLHEHPILRSVSETEFLQAVTLLSTFRRNAAGQGAVGCKRKDILKLSLNEYQNHADAVEEGHVRAMRVLMREKVFTTRNLPYQAQLVPMAAICAVLGPQFDDDAVRRKLARWYWCGVFGELYGGGTEARLALDMQQVPAWIAGGPDPRTVSDMSFAPTRLLTLQSRLSAAYKGIMAQLMEVGSLDFMTGDPIQMVTYMDESVDIHHIFPAAYCEKQKLAKTFWNSIVNKAPLTAKTNRTVGGYAPSVYTKSLEKKLGSGERLDEILRTHLIDPALLRADDFSGFIRDRATRLLDMIERATGRTVSGRDSDEVKAAFGGALMAAKGEPVVAP